jgi:hypothetical protein
MFSFDTEVMASTAYRSCFASLVKQTLQSKDTEPSRTDRSSVIAFRRYESSKSGLVWPHSLRLMKEPDDDEPYQQALFRSSISRDLPLKEGIPIVNGMNLPGQESETENETTREGTGRLPHDPSETTSPTATGSKGDENNGKYYRALYDFSETDSDSQVTRMDLEAGETVTIISKLESGWWYAASGDRYGWVPSNFLVPRDQYAEYDAESNAKDGLDVAYNPTPILFKIDPPVENTTLRTAASGYSVSPQVNKSPIGWVQGGGPSSMGNGPAVSQGSSLRAMPSLPNNTIREQLLYSPDSQDLLVEKQSQVLQTEETKRTSGQDRTIQEAGEDIAAWLRILRLHKYTDNLKGLRWKDLVELDDDGLEKLGVKAIGARRKMLKVWPCHCFSQQRSSY